MNTLLLHAIADTTRATYNSGTQAFLYFTSHYQRLHPGCSPIPASEETLMLFATYLTCRLKPASIKVYLYAVRNFHVENGLPNPLENCLQLQRLMRGIKRTYSSGPNHRLPITPTILRSFSCHLNFTYHDHLMIWAAMLLAFFGFLRSSELVGLRMGDIIWQHEAFGLAIRASKTDPFRKGITISIAATQDTTLCPVQALQQYLACQSLGPGPLFRFADGSPLTKRSLNMLVKTLSQRVGITPDRYSTHSFRIGAATTAATAGLPDWKIRMLGRWLSDSYQIYIRTPPDQLQAVPALLAKTPI